MPFTKEILKREPLKVWEHEPEYFKEEYRSAQMCPSSVDTSKEVVEVKHYCSCKHCRHEWTEIKAIAFDK